MENNYKFILIRGLEDIGDSVSREIGKILGAEAFKSDWYNKKETLSAKLKRLGRMIDKAKDNGQSVVIIGLSAGAGLAESYLLRHPEDLAYIYSLLGVLHPDIHDPNIIKLNKTSSSFREMTHDLYKRLTPQAIHASGLDSKIIAYSSLGDTVVPYKVESPPWVKTVHVVGKQDHVQAIVKIILTGLYKRIRLKSPLLD